MPMPEPDDNPLGTILLYMMACAAVHAVDFDIIFIRLDYAIGHRVSVNCNS